MLQRQVKIFDGFRLRRKNIKKCIADVRRIRVHHAHPLYAIQMRKLAQKMRQRILLAQIFAVARRILRDQNQFLHALRCQPLRLFKNRTETTAAKMAAHLRYETESAGTVAAFSNLYESVVRGRSQNARR